MLSWRQLWNLRCGDVLIVFRILILCELLNLDFWHVFLMIGFQPVDRGSGFSSGGQLECDVGVTLQLFVLMEGQSIWEQFLHSSRCNQGLATATAGFSGSVEAQLFCRGIPWPELVPPDWPRWPSAWRGSGSPQALVGFWDLPFKFGCWLHRKLAVRLPFRGSGRKGCSTQSNGKTCCKRTSLEPSSPPNPG